MLTLAVGFVAVGAVAFLGCAWALVQRAPSQAAARTSGSPHGRELRSVDEHADYSFALIRANLRERGEDR